MGAANNNFLIGFKDYFIRWIPYDEAPWTRSQDGGRTLIYYFVKWAQNKLHCEFLSSHPQMSTAGLREVGLERLSILE